MNNNKFVIAVVSTVIMVVLITNVVIPVIGNAESGTEKVMTGYGPTLIYQDEPETVDAGTFYYMMARNVDGVINVNINGGEPVTFVLSELADKTIILYSDSYATIYIENGMYKTTTAFNGVTEVPITASPISVNYRAMSSGVKYQLSSTAQSDYQPVPSYYYVMGANGDYSNFAGDNPPSMDTPTVSVAGAYIGEINTTVIEKPQYAAILEVIPILMFVGVLVAVVTMSIKKQ